MKRMGLIIALGLGFASASAFAHDEENGYGDNQRSDYQPVRHNEAGYHINHVNQMLEHVRWQMRRYRADWSTRRLVAHISGEVSHVNWEYRTGRFNWHHLRGEIERIHAELHNVEERLHVRSSDYYRWR